MNTDIRNLKIILANVSESECMFPESFGEELMKFLFGDGYGPGDDPKSVDAKFTGLIHDLTALRDDLRTPGAWLDEDGIVRRGDEKSPAGWSAPEFRDPILEKDYDKCDECDQPSTPDNAIGRYNGPYGPARIVHSACLVEI